MLNKDYLVKGEMYQYNLGWLIEELLSFKNDLTAAIDLKTIKYADPIQWDITTQYPANTVVVDPKNGTAYMSKVPVPAGVELTNTNYWVVIFNYQDIYYKIMDGVAFNDRDQDYATQDLLVNDLVWYAGDLYRVTRAIPEGSKYIPGTNLAKTTIESLLARYYGRDRTAQISNDTVNVSGDYTLVAGDIAETSNNRTIKVTKDQEIDVDGSDSVHIDGASTVNVGGLRTEAYAGDKTEGVTGKYTGKFGSASYESGAPSWPVKFSDRTVDLHNISSGQFVSVADFGAVGDGVTDDSAAIQAAVDAGNVVFDRKTYKINSTINIGSNRIIDLNRATIKAAATAFKINDSAATSPYTWIKIKNGTIDASANGIEIYNSYFIILEDLYILLNGSNTKAIYSENGFNHSYVRVQVNSRNTPAGCIGIHYIIADNSIDGITNVTNTKIDSCLIQRVAKGILFDGTIGSYDTNYIVNTGFSSCSEVALSATAKYMYNLLVNEVRCEASGLFIKTSDTAFLTVTDARMVSTPSLIDNAGYVTFGGSLNFLNVSAIFKANTGTIKISGLNRLYLLNSEYGDTSGGTFITDSLFAWTVWSNEFRIFFINRIYTGSSVQNIANISAPDGAEMYVFRRTGDNGWNLPDNSGYTKENTLYHFMRANGAWYQINKESASV